MEDAAIVSFIRRCFPLKPLKGYSWFDSGHVFAANNPLLQQPLNPILKYNIYASTSAAPGTVCISRPYSHHIDTNSNITTNDLFAEYLYQSSIIFKIPILVHTSIARHTFPCTIPEVLCRVSTSRSRAGT